MMAAAAAMCAPLAFITASRYFTISAGSAARARAGASARRTRVAVSDSLRVFLMWVSPVVRWGRPRTIGPEPPVRASQEDAPPSGVLPHRELGHSSDLLPARVPVRQGCGHEPGEEGVGGEGLRLELGVELAAHEVRVIPELDHLHQPQVRVHAAEDHPGGLEAGPVAVVELVAVAVAFVDQVGAVELV